MNRAGSFLFEPAGSVHTLECIEDDTHVWFQMYGQNLNLDADGNVESVFDGPGTLEAYYMLCEAEGLPTPERAGLVSGSVDATASPGRPGDLRRRRPARGARRAAPDRPGATGRRWTASPVLGGAPPRRRGARWPATPRRSPRERGGVVLEDLSPEQLEMMRDMLLAMDPPRHATYRKPLADTFKAKVIAGLEAADPRDLPATSWPRPPRPGRGRVRPRGDRRAADPGDGPADGPARRRTGRTLHDAGRAPDQRARTPSVGGRRRRHDCGVDRDGDVRHRASPARRRTEPPREDLTIADPRSATSAAQPMTDVDFGSFFVQLVTAGNDTTKTMLSSGLLALLQHPDQLAELRGRPDACRRARSRRSCAGRTRCTTSAAPRPSTPSSRGDGDRRRRQGGDVLHVGQPRRGGVRRPAALRHPSVARTRTSRSASPSTSASACTWPGSRAGCSSRSCSRAFPRHRAGRRSRCGCGRTSTTGFASCRCASGATDRAR